MALAVIHPRLGYVCWRIAESAVDRLRRALGDGFHGASLVIRLYDITDIEFDGLNAHRHFDVPTESLFGHHYLTLHEQERNLLGEIGFVLADRSFHALVRSNTVFVDRDRPSGRFKLGGLYVGRAFQRVFPVENVMDAPVYERLNCELLELTRATPLSVAVVSVDMAPGTAAGSRLQGLINRLAEKCANFHVEVTHFGLPYERTAADPAELAVAVEQHTQPLVQQLFGQHRTTPFELLHCHDWPTVAVGLQVAKALKLPLLLSLHSTEYERALGAELSGESCGIRDVEQAGIVAATLVVVPHSSTRHQLINLYAAPPEKVVIIADLFEDEGRAVRNPADEKRGLGFDPTRPMILFAGEVSHAAGADLLMDALLSVCRENAEVQFAFAGEGPLKGELEGRAWHAGFGDRCRFFGDVSAAGFEQLLLAADSVVIPARTWQDEGLAQLATSYGKPVLTTHQSHIHCIVHGENGFVTYDNPGSIVWGIKELLGNPLQGNMLRLLAKRRASHSQSLESAAAEYYVAYERALAIGAE